jgi:hypothetical protein
MQGSSPGVGDAGKLIISHSYEVIHESYTD